MSYNRYKHHRRSTRLKGWDYSRPGVYFVTINVKGRVCFFGSIENDKVIFSDIGKMVYKNLIALPEHFPHISLDEYVVMPNHLHVIVFIERPVEAVQAERKGVPLEHLYTDHKNNAEYYRKISPKKGSLSVIIRTYKGSVKTWCNINGYGDFEWQSRFNERVIRSNTELKRRRQYIIDNPKGWDNDDNNPMNDKRI